MPYGHHRALLFFHVEKRSNVSVWNSDYQRFFQARTYGNPGFMKRCDYEVLGWQATLAQGLPLKFSCRAKGISTPVDTGPAFCVR